MKPHQFSYPSVREIDALARRGEGRAASDGPPTQRDLVVASLLRKPEQKRGERS